MNSIDDISGAKIRVLPPISSALEKLGASVVTIAWGEVYPALAQGVIEGAVAGTLFDLHDGGFYEHAKTLILPAPSGACNDFWYINLDEWNSLPSSLQVAVTAVAKDFSHDVYRMHLKNDRTALAEMLKAGVTIYNMTESDTAKLKDVSLQVYDEMAAEDPLTAQAIQFYKDYLVFLGRF
ncbi:TRAP transporter substrate-binding protein DctP [Chloroflexota bacterium]